MIAVEVWFAEQEETFFLKGLETLQVRCCLLYTSDAADEEDSVDLGGCRIIKKKKIPSKIITLHLKCSQRIIP